MEWLNDSITLWHRFSGKHNLSRTDWDTNLPILLFAFRDVPSAATSFSPFQLIYSRQVIGPLTEWAKEDTAKTPVTDYAIRLQERMKDTVLISDMKAFASAYLDDLVVYSNIGRTICNI